MNNAAKIGCALLVLVAADAALTRAEAQTIERPTLIELKPATVKYWAAGEFTRDGKPVDAPQVDVLVRRPLAIMAHQVANGEYRRCAADKACAPLADDTAANDNMPVVMVSWRDAQSYAAWLSRKVGVRYRLPTDEEWTYAAGSRAPDESPLGAGDAVKRWISRYDREAESQAGDSTPQMIGHFGANENGLLDVSGNVWEWTDTCYTRTALDDAGNAAGAATVNCGVRIAEGRHRAYVTDFVRDARAGGCAAGIPPANLGFRLVRDNDSFWRLF
jgi:formylglycine-generating enzyme required for sulfatase activity